MAELFASGRIVDLILAFVALEALVLIGWRLYRGRGPSPVTLACNLAAGAALMLAIRAALTGSDWTIVAGCMLASLAAHLTEMCLKFRAEGAAAVGRGRSEPGTSLPKPAFTARH